MVVEPLPVPHAPPRRPLELTPGALTLDDLNGAAPMAAPAADGARAAAADPAAAAVARADAQRARRRALASRLYEAGFERDVGHKDCPLKRQEVTVTWAASAPERGSIVT